jgi:hypothetical protein
VRSKFLVLGARCPRPARRSPDNQFWAHLSEAAKEYDLSSSFVNSDNDSHLLRPNATAGTCAPVLAILPALQSFRQLLSGAWDFDTVYPEVANQSSWTPRTPDGQCGVSSAWLAEMLDQQYSIPSTFCEGSLIFDDQQAENVLDHCWLELNESDGDELILDLTCDQAQGFDTPIVFHAKADLDRQGVHYIARDRLSISDLPDSPIWPRYQTLLRNLSSPLP